MAIISGIFRFNCLKGCPTFMRFARVAEFDQVKCPKCGGEAEQERLSGKHPGMPFDVPVTSDAMSVHVKQIKEFKRINPEINVNSEGQIILKDHYERKRVMKKLRYYDRDGFL